MKVLITGGAGYIGMELIQRLVDQEEISEIVIYDNLSRGNRNLFIGPRKFPAKVQFEQGDLLDSRRLRKVLKGVDVVYHLAAKVTTPFSDQNPHLFEQVNHWGSAELAYALEESEVSKLIYLSSVSVYGTSKKPLSEKDPLNPKTFYGISKMRGEEHIERLSKKIDTFIVRCGNVYGYNRSMRFDSVINKFMFEANFHQRITVHGSGEQLRPFIHIEKVGKVLSDFIFGEVQSGVYNLVDQNLPIGEVVKALREVFPDLEILFVNQHMKMRELQVECSPRLRELIGSPESLQKELQDFRSQFTF